MKKQVSMYLMCFLLVSFTVENVYADESSLYRYTIGLSAFTGEFNVFDNGKSPAAGTLVGDYVISPYIQVGSPYRFFDNSGMGFYMEYDFTTFKFNEQAFSNGDFDIGTSVNGYSIFATPTLILSLSDYQNDKEQNQSLIIGTGIGLGYLKASGDIIYTETTQERKNINISGAAISIVVFVNLEINQFATRMAIDINSAVRGDTEYQYYKYTFNVGYIF